VKNLKRDGEVAVVGRIKGSTEHTDSRSRPTLHRRESRRTIESQVIGDLMPDEWRSLPVSDSELIESMQ